MSNILPSVLWYGGLLGLGLSVLLLLWALALYTIKHATDRFTTLTLAGALVLAVASSWGVTRATSLDQGNLLSNVHERLIQLVAASVHTRSALEDLRAVAEPSPGLTALQSKYDGHEASIETLLQAEWRYYRGRPWDEPALLYKMTWDVNDIRVHHARHEKRAEALECPANPAVPFLDDASARLRDRLQAERTLAETLRKQFGGYDVVTQDSSSAGGVRTMRLLAGLAGVLAIASAAAVAFAARKRSWHPLDGLVAIAALVLAGLAGWLALGAGADQGRLRDDLVARAAAVDGETLDLGESMKALMLLPRGGVLQPRDSRERLIADYGEYLNSVSSLASLVRVWDAAVLTGTLDTGVVSSQKIQTHDDLLDAIRSRMLMLYRQYVQLDRRMTDLSCRSEWFPRNEGRTREDVLLMLP
jgi:hypothetical protein